jgi:hypothetical protein
MNHYAKLTGLVALGVFLQSAHKVIEVFLLLLALFERSSLKFRIVSLDSGISLLDSDMVMSGIGLLRKAPPRWV